MAELHLDDTRHGSMAQPNEGSSRGTMASSAKPFSGKRPAVLAVLVLVAGSLSRDKVDLSRYLPRGDVYSETASTLETNNATVSKTRRMSAGNATNATVPSSSSSRAVEGSTNGGSTDPDPGRMTSPASCRPHFRAALPDGGWTSDVKFKRLYFYHTRKAGVRRFAGSGRFLSSHRR